MDNSRIFFDKALEYKNDKKTGKENQIMQTFSTPGVDFEHNTYHRVLMVMNLQK